MGDGETQFLLPSYFAVKKYMCGENRSHVALCIFIEIQEHEYAMATDSFFLSLRKSYRILLVFKICFDIRSKIDSDI